MKLGKFVYELVAALFEVISSHALFWMALLAIKFAYVLLGLVFGWITGWFFGDTILAILADLGIEGYAMWQIGAFLGFVGSFFGGTTNFNNFTKQNQQPDRPPYNYPHR